MRENVALVQAAREAVGDDMDILLDIGFIPSAEVTIDAASRIQLVRELEQFNPYAVEEALWPHDYDGYRRLVESTRVRIVCGENETTRFGFKQLIDYVKVGPYKEDLGPLNKRTTNQRLYKMVDGVKIDITERFWKNSIN